MASVDRADGPSMNAGARRYEIGRRETREHEAHGDEPVRQVQHQNEPVAQRAVAGPAGMIMAASPSRMP